MTNVASGRGLARLTTSRIGTPSQTLSSFDQRVTQWMSDVTVARGNFRNSGHVQVTARSTRPKQRNVQRAGSNRGVRPYARTGHLAVSVCPGGTRPASAGSTCFIRDLRDVQSLSSSFAIALHYTTPARSLSGRAAPGRIIVETSRPRDARSAGPQEW